MPIAHVCHNCGIDLSHIRPVREPHYNLMIILCPDCGKGCVRINRPILRPLRIPWKILKAALILVGQALILFMLTSAAAQTVDQIARAIHYSSFLEEFFEALWPYTTIQYLAMSFLVGIWLSAGLAHLSYWKSRMIWGLFTTVFLVYGILSSDIMNIFDPPQSMANRFSPWDQLGDSIIRFLLAMIFLFLALILSLASVPLGKALVRGNQRRCNMRWCKRRSKLRRRRNS